MCPQSEVLEHYIYLEEGKSASFISNFKFPFLHKQSSSQNDVWKLSGDVSLTTYETLECAGFVDLRIVHAFFMFLAWGAILPIGKTQNTKTNKNTHKHQQKGMFAARFLKHLKARGDDKHPWWFFLHRIFQISGTKNTNTNTKPTNITINTKKELFS